MKKLNEILGTKYPFIQGGMANIATGEFAAACSNAGALGMIATGGWDGDRLRQEIRRAKELTDKPFGVNLMLMSPYADDIAQIILEEGVKVVTTGAGNPGKYITAWKEAGIKVLPVQADVCADGDNEATVQNVVKQAVDAFGGIQVLINNAQASASGVSLAEHTTEQFDLALYSGLYAAFYYMKACYPYLKESHGSVINFASGAGLFGNYGQCAYAAAKEGIRGLSRVAATEWGPDDINVNVVCPLAWTAKLEQFQQAYPEAFKANVKMPPMGHYGNAELEIGRVCVQLAMPDFKFMSGETLTLEGGMGQRP